MTEIVERSLSALSISSSSAKSEDWDRSQYDISRTTAPCTPSPRRRRVDLPTAETADGTPSRRTGRSLFDLLRLHAEKGKDLTLNPEEERRLSEALATWVNSEDDDAAFESPSDEDPANTNGTGAPNKEPKSAEALEPAEKS